MSLRWMPLWPTLGTCAYPHAKEAKRVSPASVCRCPCADQMVRVPSARAVVPRAAPRFQRTQRTAVAAVVIVGTPVTHACPASVVAMAHLAVSMATRAATKAAPTCLSLRRTVGRVGWSVETGRSVKRVPASLHPVILPAPTTRSATVIPACACVVADPGARRGKRAVVRPASTRRSTATTAAHVATLARARRSASTAPARPTSPVTQHVRQARPATQASASAARVPAAALEAHAVAAPARRRRPTI